MRIECLQTVANDLISMHVLLSRSCFHLQIVAGLRKHVPKFEMEGRRVATILNLKTAKLAGQLSEGMILAAVQKGEEFEHGELVKPLNVPGMLRQWTMHHFFALTAFIVLGIVYIAYISWLAFLRKNSISSLEVMCLHWRRKYYLVCQRMCGPLKLQFI